MFAIKRRALIRECFAATTSRVFAQESEQKRLLKYCDLPSRVPLKRCRNSGSPQRSQHFGGTGTGSLPISRDDLIKLGYGGVVHPHSNPINHSAKVGFNPIRRKGLGGDESDGAVCASVGGGVCPAHVNA